MKTALITGASSGIGKELAYIFAKDKHNLVLVARSEDKLKEIAEEIKTRDGVEVTVIPMDLSKQGSAKELFNQINTKNIEIDFLINNAGFGDVDHFSSKKLDKYTQMINLNMLALTELTALFIDKMKEKKFGYIMNVASTAAFQSVPYFSVYAATKAYVLSFSEALHYELKGTGVYVSALCPGATDTNFANAAEIKGSDMFNAEKGGMTPKKVAEIAYRKMMKGKMTFVTGFANQIGAYFSPKMINRKIVPSTIGKVFRKLIKEN